MVKSSRNKMKLTQRNLFQCIETSLVFNLMNLNCAVLAIAFLSTPVLAVVEPSEAIGPSSTLTIISGEVIVL